MTTPISLDASNDYMTFGAVIMELAVPPRFRVTAGPPHLNSWVEIGFTAE